MERMIKKIIVTALGGILALTVPLTAMAANNNLRYTVTPWTFVGNAGDCGTDYPAGTRNLSDGSMNVVSRWVDDMGNPAPSLYLQKAADTADCSSAGANINGVTGLTNLTELNFDYYSADPNAHCGAGAPRFNVTTSENVTHFIGCSAGTATDLGNGWTHVVFDPASSSQAFSPITPDMTISSIQIVFDEKGYTHLDNISINGQIVGRGHTPWNKLACQNDGFKNYVDNFGHTYKNFGQCASYVTRNHHELVLSANGGVNVRTITNTNSTTNSGTRM